MKICHLADTHLGSGESHPKRGESGLTLRQEDIYISFVEAIDKIIELKPDVCIHAGDIFDKVRPSNRILAMTGEQLHRLAEIESIPTVIIAGNHDAPRRQFEGAALEVYRNIRNLYIAAGSRLEIFELGGCSFYALPHCLTTEIQKEELKKCLPNPKSRFNVLILHGVAAGMPEFSMADLGEQELPLETMSRFDYNALGHFHNFCQVGHRAWYSGSSERLSQSERESPKGFLEVHLDPFDLKFHEVKCREMIDIQTISGRGKRGDEIAEEIKRTVERIDSSDKIVRVKIADISEEAIKTIPSAVINDLKQKSFSLNVTLEKEKSENAVMPQLSRQVSSGIEAGFMEYLESVELNEFDKERLKREAKKYFADDQ